MQLRPSFCHLHKKNVLNTCLLCIHANTPDCNSYHVHPSQIMALTWAGSQVTKLVRAGGALAMAPFVDKGLDMLVEKFQLPGKGNAVAGVVIFCLLLALVVFGVVVLAWS